LDKQLFKVNEIEMNTTPFDREYTTSYQSPIASIPYHFHFVPFSRYLTLKNVVTLKSTLYLHNNWPLQLVEHNFANSQRLLLTDPQLCFGAGRLL